MKIKIDSDVHDITIRVKEIDDGYFIVYNTDKDCYEIHNSKQKDTYCLTCPYEFLDDRVLGLVCMSNIQNIDTILEDIDNNNSSIEQNAIKTTKDIGDYKAREIYKFANNSSKNFDSEKAFNEVWR